MSLALTSRKARASFDNAWADQELRQGLGGNAARALLRKIEILQQEHRELRETVVDLKRKLACYAAKHAIRHNDHRTRSRSRSPRLPCLPPRPVEIVDLGSSSSCSSANDSDQGSLDVVSSAADADLGSSDLVSSSGGADESGSAEDMDRVLGGDALWDEWDLEYALATA